MPLSVALCLGLTGCGVGKGDITGVVRYRGQTLTTGQVLLLPEGGGIMATDIGPDGSYALTSVPAGAARFGVSVVAPAVTQHYREMAGQVKAGASDAGRVGVGKTQGYAKNLDQFQLVPAKYGDPNGSGLTYEVTPGPQSYNIDLQ